MGIISDYFHNSQMNLNINNNIYDNVMANFMKYIGHNLASETDTDLLLVTKPKIFDLGNDLGLLSEN